jgi:hypothetical protein
VFVLRETDSGEVSLGTLWLSVLLLSRLGVDFAASWGVIDPEDCDLVDVVEDFLFVFGRLDLLVPELATFDFLFDSSGGLFDLVSLVGLANSILDEFTLAGLLLSLTVLDLLRFCLPLPSDNDG